jgi:hypothetical protein
MFDFPLMWSCAVFEKTFADTRLRNSFAFYVLIVRRPNKTYIFLKIDIQYKIQATPPYKNTEGVEFASNFLQIEIRNIWRLFYLS